MSRVFVFFALGSVACAAGDRFYALLSRQESNGGVVDAEYYGEAWLDLDAADGVTLTIVHNAPVDPQCDTPGSLYEGTCVAMAHATKTAAAYYPQPDGMSQHISLAYPGAAPAVPLQDVTAGVAIDVAADLADFNDGQYTVTVVYDAAGGLSISGTLIPHNRVPRLLVARAEWQPAAAAGAALLFGELEVFDGITRSSDGASPVRWSFSWEVRPDATGAFTSPGGDATLAVDSVTDELVTLAGTGYVDAAFVQANAWAVGGGFGDVAVGSAKTVVSGGFSGFQRHRAAVRGVNANGSLVVGAMGLSWVDGAAAIAAGDTLSVTSLGATLGKATLAAPEDVVLDPNLQTAANNEALDADGPAAEFTLEALLQTGQASDRAGVQPSDATARVTVTCVVATATKAFRCFYTWVGDLAYSNTTHVVSLQKGAPGAAPAGAAAVAELSAVGEGRVCPEAGGVFCATNDVAAAFAAADLPDFLAGNFFLARALRTAAAAVLHRGQLAPVGKTADRYSENYFNDDFPDARVAHLSLPHLSAFFEPVGSAPNTAPYQQPVPGIVHFTSHRTLPWAFTTGFSSSFFPNGSLPSVSPGTPLLALCLNAAAPSGGSPPGPVVAGGFGGFGALGGPVRFPVFLRRRPALYAKVRDPASAAAHPLVFAHGLLVETEAAARCFVDLEVPGEGGQGSVTAPPRRVVYTAEWGADTSQGLLALAVTRNADEAFTRITWEMAHSVPDVGGGALSDSCGRADGCLVLLVDGVPVANLLRGRHAGPAAAEKVAGTVVYGDLAVDAILSLVPSFANTTFGAASNLTRESFAYEALAHFVETQRAAVTLLTKSHPDLPHGALSAPLTEQIAHCGGTSERAVRPLSVAFDAALSSPAAAGYARLTVSLSTLAVAFDASLTSQNASAACQRPGCSPVSIGGRYDLGFARDSAEVPLSMRAVLSGGTGAPAPMWVLRDMSQGMADLTVFGEVTGRVTPCGSRSFAFRTSVATADVDGNGLYLVWEAAVVSSSARFGYEHLWKVEYQASDATLAATARLATVDGEPIVVKMAGAGYFFVTPADLLEARLGRWVLEIPATGDRAVVMTDEPHDVATSLIIPDATGGGAGGGGGVFYEEAELTAQHHPSSGALSLASVLPGTLCAPAAAAAAGSCFVSAGSVARGTALGRFAGADSLASPHGGRPIPGVPGGTAHAGFLFATSALPLHEFDDTVQVAASSRVVLALRGFPQAFNPLRTGVEGTGSVGVSGEFFRQTLSAHAAGGAPQTTKTYSCAGGRAKDLAAGPGMQAWQAVPAVDDAGFTGTAEIVVGSGYEASVALEHTVAQPEGVYLGVGKPGRVGSLALALSDGDLGVPFGMDLVRAADSGFLFAVVVPLHFHPRGSLRCQLDEVRELVGKEHFASVGPFVHGQSTRLAFDSASSALPVNASVSSRRSHAVARTGANPSAGAHFFAALSSSGLVTYQLYLADSLVFDPARVAEAFLVYRGSPAARDSAVWQKFRHLSAFPTVGAAAGNPPESEAFFPRSLKKRLNETASRGWGACFSAGLPWEKMMLRRGAVSWVAADVGGDYGALVGLVERTSTGTRFKTSWATPPGGGGFLTHPAFSDRAATEVVFEATGAGLLRRRMPPFAAAGLEVDLRCGGGDGIVAAFAADGSMPLEQAVLSCLRSGAAQVTARNVSDGGKQLAVGVVTPIDGGLVRPFESFLHGSYSLPRLAPSVTGNLTGVVSYGSVRTIAFTLTLTYPDFPTVSDRNAWLTCSVQGGTPCTGKQPFSCLSVHLASPDETDQSLSVDRCEPALRVPLQTPGMLPVTGSVVGVWVDDGGSLGVAGGLDFLHLLHAVLNDGLQVVARTGPRAGGAARGTVHGFPLKELGFRDKRAELLTSDAAGLTLLRFVAPLNDEAEGFVLELDRTTSIGFVNSSVCASSPAVECAFALAAPDAQVPRVVSPVPHSEGAAAVPLATFFDVSDSFLSLLSGGQVVVGYPGAWRRVLAVEPTDIFFTECSEAYLPSPVSSGVECLASFQFHPSSTLLSYSVLLPTGTTCANGDCGVHLSIGPRTYPISAGVPGAAGLFSRRYSGELEGVSLSDVDEMRASGDASVRAELRLGASSAGPVVALQSDTLRAVLENAQEIDPDEATTDFLGHADVLVRGDTIQL
eukprot:gene1603-2394_t